MVTGMSGMMSDVMEMSESESECEGEGECESGMCEWGFVGCVVGVLMLVNWGFMWSG